MRVHRWVAALILIVLACGTSVRAAPIPASSILGALRGGGYVVVMRHASSPPTRPDAAAADPENLGLERQLDAAGRASAVAVGQAIRTLKIPLGSVVSSPTYRARQTVALMGLGPATTAVELGDGGQSMSATASASAAWLRSAVAAPPRAGSDTLLITHQPNMAAAFSQDAAGLEDGETLVFHPDGKGGSELVARVRAGDWAGLRGR